MHAPPFPAWFRENAGFAPHPWQARLAGRSACDDRLIRTPTGMGKTLAMRTSISACAEHLAGTTTVVYEKGAKGKASAGRTKKASAKKTPKPTDKATP